MFTTFKTARLAAVLALGAGIAAANPIINIIYDSNVAFTAADKAQIQNAINFYTSNITDSFTLTIAFGGQAGGGGASSKFISTANYSDYYSALVAHSSGNATDTSAIASLGGGAHTTNPVTGSSQIQMTDTLAFLLGLGTQTSDTFAECGGLTANACVTISNNALNGGPGGTPLAGLFGIVQHEVDEVLGTGSALRNGTPVPADPSATICSDIARSEFAALRTTRRPMFHAPACQRPISRSMARHQSQQLQQLQ